MGDTIYRQDAIDAVADGLKRVFVENRDVAEILLKSVPSAQPEQTNTANALKSLDCISRQAVIDAFENTKEVAK